MERTIVIVEQLEEAKALINRRSTPSLRMALLLLDNAAEVLMHRAIDLSDYLRGSMLGIRRCASNDLKDTFAEKCHRMPQERESFKRGGPSSAAIHLDA
jgi:hypothetical protein